MRKQLIPAIFLMGCYLLFLASCQTAEKTSGIVSTPTYSPTATLEILEIEPDITDEETVQIGDSTPIEIVLWHPFSGVAAEEIELLIQAFNQQNIGQIVVSAYSHADVEILYENVMQATEDGESKPEILLAPSNEIKNLYALGEIIEIDSETISFIDDEPAAKPFPAFWNLDVVNGKRIAVPFYQSGSFIFYNQSWANDLGFTNYPKTIDEFSEQVCTAYLANRYDDEPMNDGTGGYFYPQGSVPILAWLNAFGGGPVFNTRNELRLGGDENMQSLSFLNTLFSDDCAWWTTKEDNPYRYFAERYAIAYSAKVENIFAQQVVMDELSSDVNWLLLPYPSIDERPILFFESYSFAFMDDSKDKTEAAAKVIEWLMQPENHAELVYKTGVFPLRTNEIREIDADWPLYGIWSQTLQYIPFLQPVPQAPKWYVTERVLADVGWQTIQFGVTSAAVPDILTAAESLVNTWE